MPQEKLRPSFTFDQNRIDQLKGIVPEAFADGKINWQVLHEALGDYLEPQGPQDEHFGLFWPGKREARMLASIPSTGTLVPCPSEGTDENQTHNIFIEGDNLEVLKLIQRSYAGQVKLIYIDPPYNTGNDFVYNDDFQEPLQKYLQQTGQADEQGKLLTTNPKSSGRFHSNWLNMMYPRLRIAKTLLAENGAICVSIGEEELVHLRIILSEVFGEENYRNTLLVRRYDKNLNRQFMEQGLVTLNVGAEYVLVYANSVDFSLNPVYRAASEKRQNFGYWKGFWNAPNRPTMRYDLLGVTPKTGQWKWKKDIADVAVANYKKYLKNSAGNKSLEDYWAETGKQLKFIRRNPSGSGKNQGVEHWIPPSSGILRTSNWTDILASETLTNLGLKFDNPKNVALLTALVRLCSDDDDLILDFFAGSCTMAQAIFETNQEDGGKRRFIMVQLPELNDDPEYPTISSLAKERIRLVSKNLKKQNAKGDLGFKVYKLDRSNFKAWQDYHGEDIAQLEMLFDGAETPLIDDWTPESLLAEVILIQGFPLDSTVTQQTEFKKNKVNLIESATSTHRLFVCLDSKVCEETEKALKVNPDDIFVCLDSAITDQTKMRLSNNCTLATI